MTCQGGYAGSMLKFLRLCDSITDAGAREAGKVVVSGSHGGVYPAWLASRVGARAAIFNDAGIGLEGAGIGGVIALDVVGMAAASVDCMSARIGDAADMLARGRISYANPQAKALGVRPGMAVTQAAGLLRAAPIVRAALPAPTEAHATRVLMPETSPVHLLDSASMVTPEHLGEIVVTGSHGGLVGGDPARALKAAARVAAFNDAGLGPDNIGVARLWALEAQGTAAVTVAAMSAKIGDAASALETGVISHANEPAKLLGAEQGTPLREWLLRLVQEH